MDNQQEIVDRARRDLAQRLGIEEKDVSVGPVAEVEFPDAALGAPVEDELSAQMITPGWRIQVKAENKSFEYRASGSKLRLYNFNGKNYRIGT